MRKMTTERMLEILENNGYARFKVVDENREFGKWLLVDEIHIIYEATYLKECNCIVIQMLSTITVHEPDYIHF